MVFPKEVKNRTQTDARLKALQERIAAADKAERARLTAEKDEVASSIYAEKLNELADECEQIHSVQRARDVGSLHDIIAPSILRPYLIDAVERGIKQIQNSTRSGTSNRAMALQPTTGPEQHETADSTRSDG